MKTAMLVFFMTLFAGIAFSQSKPNFNGPQREKASDSKVRFYITLFYGEPIQGRFSYGQPSQGRKSEQIF